MVKRYYIQDYPENIRGDTETTRSTVVLSLYLCQYHRYNLLQII